MKRTVRDDSGAWSLLKNAAVRASPTARSSSPPEAPGLRKSASGLPSRSTTAIERVLSESAEAAAATMAPTSAAHSAGPPHTASPGGGGVSSGGEGSSPGVDGPGSGVGVGCAGGSLSPPPSRGSRTAARRSTAIPASPRRESDSATAIAHRSADCIWSSEPSCPRLYRRRCSEDQLPGSVSAPISSISSPLVASQRPARTLSW